MGVLVEGISVIVRRTRIDAVYPGGWEAYVKDCPNHTLCWDRHLASVRFMMPDDVGEFVRHLESLGLMLVRDGEAVDFVVVDQLRGPTSACAWFEFGHVYFAGNRVAVGQLAGSASLELMTPDGWRYEGSLSDSCGFMPRGMEGKTLRFLRREASMDVYQDLLTGREVYVGRTRKAEPESSQEDITGDGGQS